MGFYIKTVAQQIPTVDGFSPNIIDSCIIFPWPSESHSCCSYLSSATEAFSKAKAAPPESNAPLVTLHSSVHFGFPEPSHYK